MDDQDKRIGANLAAVRGNMSQTALAEAMRARKWKWTQPTVASLEKGDRSLKLAEASDICVILQVELEDLLPPERIRGEVELPLAWEQVQKKVLETVPSLFELANSLSRFLTLTDAFPDSVNKIWGDGEEDWSTQVKWLAETVTSMSHERIKDTSHLETISAALFSVAESVLPQKNGSTT